MFRTFLRAAGFSWEFCWWDEESPRGLYDIYYGRTGATPLHGATPKARLEIQACGRPFRNMGAIEPEQYREAEGLPFLEFSSVDTSAPLCQETGRLVFSNDILFAAYWLLSGAREPAYTRDRWDNLNLSNSFFLRHSLQQTPVVSLYAALFADAVRQLGLSNRCRFQGRARFLHA